MTTYLVTIGLILILLLGWVTVQQFYRLFARRHPELGPFRSDSGGCGCCSQGSACSSDGCRDSHAG
ncbi:MAG: hypothetical protein PHR30_03325 [Gallionellaceae bacterium]|nr:hypothetical protein [Gallionellaceae bacterium]